MEVVPTKSNVLYEMFELQKPLMDEYIIIESLPDYPCDLNIRSNQAHIRKEIARYIVELSEAYEWVVSSYLLVSGNKGDDAKDSVRNYNMEIADTWHFLLEILVFCGYEALQVDDLLRKFVVDNPRYGGLYEKNKPLKTLLKFANFDNQVEGITKICTRNTAVFSLASFDEGIKDPSLVGGRSVNLELIDTHAKLMWKIAYALSITGNELKNKEHNQTDRQVNMMRFESNLMMALKQVAIYMDFACFTEISIFNCYYYKNQENLKRIKEKY